MHHPRSNLSIVSVTSPRVLRVLASAVMALAMLAFLPSRAAHAAGDGAKVVKGAYDSIAKLLKAKAPAAKVTKSVREFLDVDELGKRALGEQWDKLSATERTEYLSVLRDLIEANYVKGLRDNLKYTVEYGVETAQADGTILVATVIKTKRKGRPYSIAVDYVLVKDGAKLRCFDIKTDGVGLVENYRAQFAKIIAKGGMKDLIAKLKKKLKALKA